jgi:hypothetical protein
VGICSGSEKINQEELKRVCAKVLNIEEFNKEVFLKNVDYISVPKRDILEFHFKNGEIITERYRP